MTLHVPETLEHRTLLAPVERFIDCVWRGVVRRRLDVTLEELEPLQGKTVLDVGCGSGRFCLAYHVLGH